MSRFPLLAFAAAITVATTSFAQTSASSAVRELTDLPYKNAPTLTDYEQERCKLDVYLPKGAKGFATLVWFHGGGLQKGDKNGEQIANDSVKTVRIARSLAAAGVAIVAPNYRFSPKVKFPAYIQDAAAAVAWTRTHIAEHGGDPAKVFVGGHSAGGYLTLMLGLDPQYLEAVGAKPSDFAGYIPVSGQTLTHYTVREERGLPKFPAVADEAAPLHLIRAETPPFLVLYADNDMAARAEENALLVAVLKAAGNKRVTGQMIAGRTHGSIAGEIEKDGDPARTAILDFIRANSEPR